MELASKTYAIEKHGEQRYGSLPYEYHLEMVASIIREYFEGHIFLDSLVNVAYLHDVREDTDTTLEDLLSRFTITESYAVDLLSDEDGSTRKERKTLTYRKFTEFKDLLIKALAAILSRFTITESYAVVLLSDEDGLTRKERKTLTYRKFTEFKDLLIKALAATIKFSDRLANLRHSISQIKDMDEGKDKEKSISKLKMYMNEHQEFVSVYKDFVLSEKLKKDVIEFDFSV
ncbi:hypothetical protein [Vibrio parahaemolyticus]|uniref:hypothetical protein n=1 Tax=Vibrio parahaemolyticus TaxID=670 RepID=UPI00226AA844|nr:hypothetical protein [Vibrio parahaemolyticus]MCX8796603.1 hypothetical protein [Vibrio parahaemolyticus]